MTKDFIEIQEHGQVLLPAERLSEELATFLHEKYGQYVEVEFPSPVTWKRWRLTSKGVVGVLPLSQHVSVVIVPKVSLGNLFRMLEVATDVRLDILPGEHHTESLVDFFDRLASLLVRMVLARVRKGLYRTYQARREELLHLRGRFDLASNLRSPWRTRFDCRYQEHTADVTDNQILAWTLYLVTQHDLCTGATRNLARRAYRALQQTVTPIPIKAEVCLRRLYNRLNTDYAPMHALCWFFLESCGPHHVSGEQRMLPFVVNMPLLYERFVYRTLEHHLPEGLGVRAQERVDLQHSENLSFKIDMVLYDTVTGEALCVLDTKYKASKAPSSADLSQIVSYAAAKKCLQCGLISPVAQMYSNISVGDYSVHLFGFLLGGDLDSTSRAFIDELLEVGIDGERPKTQSGA